MIAFLASAIGQSVGRAILAWGGAVLILSQFAIVWGYYVLFEGLNDGRTPGKAWLGLRVVQDAVSPCPSRRRRRATSRASSICNRDSCRPSG